MQKNQFGGIFIPREVLIDEDLTMTCKVLYGFVQSLDGERGCFAQNAYLAGLIKASEETVRASLYILEKKGYIARFRLDDNSRSIRTRTTCSLSESNVPWNKLTKASKTPPQENLGVQENLGSTPPEKSGVLYSSDIPNSIDIHKKEFVDYINDKEFQEVWKEFKAMRKKLRRPLSAMAEKLIFKKLVDVKKDTAIKAVELSIERSWIGVFPDAVEYSLRKTNGKPFVDSREPLQDGDHVTF